MVHCRLPKMYHELLEHFIQIVLEWLSPYSSPLGVEPMYILHQHIYFFHLFTLFQGGSIGAHAWYVTSHYWSCFWGLSFWCVARGLLSHSVYGRLLHKVCAEISPLFINLLMGNTFLDIFCTFLGGTYSTTICHTLSLMLCYYTNSLPTKRKL